jgi:hypothetical protein
METDAGDGHVMPRNIYWFRGNWYSEIHFSLENLKRNFTPFLLYIFAQCGYNSAKGISINVYYNRGFVKIITVKFIVYLGAYVILYQYFPHFFSISVQFATRNLHTFLLNICKF